MVALIISAHIPVVRAASKAQAAQEVQTTAACVAAKALAAHARVPEVQAAPLAAEVRAAEGPSIRAHTMQGPIPCSGVEQGHQGVLSQKTPLESDPNKSSNQVSACLNP